MINRQRQILFLTISCMLIATSSPAPATEIAAEMSFAPSVKNEGMEVADEANSIISQSRQLLPDKAKQESTEPIKAKNPKHKPVEKQHHQYFVAFTEEGQISTGDIHSDSSAIIAGEPGTIFATSERGVHLQTGSLMLSSASTALSIYTRSCQIDVQPNSAVAVDVDRAHSAECVSGSASIVRKDGYQAMLLPKQRAMIELVPKDSDPKFTSDHRARFFLTVRDWNLEDQSQPSGLGHLIGQIDNFRSAGSAKTQLEPARIFAAPGASFCVPHVHALQVVSGSMLVDLPQGTAIQTTSGEVLATHRSSIALQVMPKAVFAGNCSIGSTVVVKASYHKVPLYTGRSCLIIGGIVPAGAQITDGIPRRRMNTYSDGRITGITADFSILAFVQSCKSAKLAIIQPLSKRERKYGSHLLKAMAAYYTVTSAAESYEATSKVSKIRPFGYFRNPLLQSGPST